MIMQNALFQKTLIIFIIYVFILSSCNKVEKRNDLDSQTILQTSTPKQIVAPASAQAKLVPTVPAKEVNTLTPPEPIFENTIATQTSTPASENVNSILDSEDLKTPNSSASTNRELSSLSGYLVFESRRDDSNNDGVIDLTDHIQIFLMDISKDEVTQLTFSDHHSLDPSWSPNGDKIVFSANPEGVYNLFIVNADGSNIQQITSSEFDERSPEWSPNGNYIVYESTDRVSLRSNLQIISLNSMEISHLDTGSGKSPNSPSWSPNSKYLAYADRNETFGLVFVLNIESGDATQFAPSSLPKEASLFNPTWLPTNNKNEYMLLVEQVPGNISSSTAIVFKLSFNDGKVDSQPVFSIEDSFGEMTWANEGHWLISTLSDVTKNNTTASAEFSSRELVKLMIDFSTQEYNSLIEGKFYNYSLVENSELLTSNTYYDGDPDWTP